MFNGLVSDGNWVEKSRQGLLDLGTPVSVRTTFFRVDTVFIYSRRGASIESALCYKENGLNGSSVHR